MWFLLLTFSLDPAFAQEAPAAPRTREARFAEVTRMDFDRALEVEGELVRPSVSLVDADRRAAFAHFIRLRTDFREELVASARWVR